MTQLSQADQLKQQSQAQQPWYKQAWLWFVLAPLIAVLIYASLFIYLAITTSDGVVKEDYYKVARGLSIDDSRLAAAREAGINGELVIDNLTGDIQLRLQALVDLPPQLELNLVHPTHQKYDQKLLLRAVGNSGVYSGNLPGPIEGKRYLILEPADQHWQIRAELTPPYDQAHIALGDPR